MRELKAFKKIALDGGESAAVSFALKRKDLEFVDTDLRWTAEPGIFDVWIAPSSSEGSGKSFELTR